MNLIYFTKDAYKLLKKDLNANKDNYYSDDPWLAQYFADQGLEEYCKTSSIVVPNFQLLNVEDGDNDAKNRCRFSEHKDFIPRSTKIKLPRSRHPIRCFGLHCVI